jgi:cyclomaltodextrinase / maltogenic alpha-amylase / neopullulanase
MVLVGRGGDETLRLAQRGGDVWAASVLVRGTGDGCEEVVVDGMTVDPGRFEARVELARGENEVIAECGHARAERRYVRRDQERPEPVEAADRPAWVDEAVVYGVVPAVFGETGGFRDVTARLDELAELGVTALWLSPINESPDGDFGYAVVDYFGLRPEYGSEADFRQLVEEAHARGIRVLMDFVPNHTSIAHPYHRDAATHGRASRYWDFYDRDADGQPTHYFDWAHLPNLNYDNPEVRTMMLEAFAYWVREFDVDGFRVDVAWGVKERAPDFWPEWRAQLHAIKPDLFLLAEASALDPYYFDHGFDAAYDWTEDLGHWAWEGVFEHVEPAELVASLDAAVRASHVPGRLVFRFLNNNDTGPSFVSRHGPDLTRVASAALLTLSGIPLIWTGEEVGASYSPYVDNAPVVWRDRYGLVEHYERLIAMRKRLPALHGPGFEPLPVDAAGVYAYVRSAPGAADVVVALNFAGEPRRVELPHGRFELAAYDFVIREVQ